MSAFIDEFRSPGCEYRGKPFWAWNGKLAPDELRRQVRIMEDMGLGGFFMHSRVGLDTPYLQDRWFECIDACIDEAETFGMEAWLYDEDRWPSGAAGGLVTKNEEYRQAYFCFREYGNADEFSWEEDILAVFAAKIDGSNATAVRRIDKGGDVKLNEGETLISFTFGRSEVSSWYNGFTYLDVLNPDAVAEFIRVTHEEYLKRTGRHFGKAVPGIFTDEPNHGDKFFNRETVVTADCSPWTKALPEVFVNRYGYDLIPHLMELVYNVDGDGVTPARYHYHDCLAHLFVDSFARQIGEWCEKNGILHTGHVLCEGSLSGQTRVVSNCMRFYEYMQAPGMDILTEHWREYITAKQVSSVARQTGRKWRLTETYGCTGWDFPFMGHKAVGDWQVALGINLRCQHLSWYTMEGQAKRDYPASIFYQSPWCEAYSEVENYFARVHAAMTCGVEVRDVLVIHPVESMWLKVCKRWMAEGECRKLDASFSALTDKLLMENIDFDYGDEEMLGRLGGVEVGNVARLRLGEAAYSVVVVPESVTMRSSTLKLLNEFRAAGGEVVFVGDIPGYVDAMSSEEVREFSLSCVVCDSLENGFISVVEKKGRRVSIAGKNEEQIKQSLYLLREDKAGFYFFVCNTGFAVNDNVIQEAMARDRKESFDSVFISGFAGCRGTPVELDPITGKVMPIDCVVNDTGISINTSLPELGSRIFFIPKTKADEIVVDGDICGEELGCESLDSQICPISLSDYNCVVFDRPEFIIDGNEWQTCLEVLDVDHKVRDYLGVARRGGRMVQPWARDDIVDNTSVDVALRYTFNVDDLPKTRLYIALENPGCFRITVNGFELDPDDDCGWWVDQSLRKIPLNPAALRKGENELLLECAYQRDFSGLEIVYLLGNFGVALSGNVSTIVECPRILELRDWGEQGLPFYSGNVLYEFSTEVEHKDGEHVFVRIGDYAGVGVRVWVDGKQAGVVGWQPNEVDITEFLPDGGNKVNIVVEILGSRRNSHGPLHNAEKWPQWTGPAQYTDDVTDYQLVPSGLMESPAIIRKRVIY